jgi:hypothetical protein
MINNNEIKIRLEGTLVELNSGEFGIKMDELFL